MPPPNCRWSYIDSTAKFYMTGLSESCDDCDETSDEDSLTEDGEDDEDDEG